MSLNIDYLLLDQRLDASIAALDAALARAGRSPCGPSDEVGIVPAVTAPAVPSPGVRILKKSRRFASDDVVLGRLLAMREALRLSGLPGVICGDFSAPSFAHDCDERARFAELLHPSEALPCVLDRYEKLRSDFTLYGLKVASDFNHGDGGLVRVDKASLAHQSPLVKNDHSH